MTQAALQLDGTLVVEFTVAGPPRGKARPRFARATGHAYTDEATRNYEATLRLIAQQAMAGRPPLDGPVRLVVTATFEVPSSWSQRKRSAALGGALYPTVKPDFDNIAKLTDALNGVVWSDDKQVVEGVVCKVYGVAPMTRFFVEEIPSGR